MNTTSNVKNGLLAVLIAGCSLGFIISLDFRPYSLSFLVKSLPIFLLASMVLLNIRNSKGKLITAGLVFSGIGDVVLAIDANRLFIFGIGAFTLAHLFYISVFLRSNRINKFSLSVIVALMIFAVVIGRALYPYLGRMAVPVFFYLGVILFMAASAALGENNHRMLVIGAMIFIISDSLIAIKRFVSPFPYNDHWIMSTYYLAQFSIVYGSFRSFKKA